MADGSDSPLIGEVLPPMTDVVVQDSPFTTAHIKLQVGCGATIGEIVSQANIPIEFYPDLQVFIADEEILPGIWHLARPKPGVEVFVRVNLRGGDGGGKDVLRAVAMIAIMVVATIYAGPAGAAAATALFGSGAAAVGSALAIAAVTTVGGLLVNALIPPPSTKNQWGFDQELGNPYGSITGLRNNASPYGPIPRVFGKRRMFPMLAGRPYTETIGNDQYLRLLLLVGLGPVKISDIKLGETPIDAVQGVEIETREGWESDADVTLYQKAIKEDGYSVVMDAAGTSTIKTTRLNTKEISVELAFPSGVNRLKDGELRFHEVSFTVQYRVSGSGGPWINADWTDKNSAYGTQNAGVIFVRDKTQNGLRKSGRWSVTPGQYDVMITRTSAKPPMGETDYAMFTTLRSIVDTPFLPMKGLALIALRMKASGQLNGVPDTINCVAESYLPVWNGAAWNYQITRNPAWAYADILRRRGTQVMMADDRIDLPTIKAWADANDAAPPSGAGPYWTFDGVIEGGSMFTGLRTAASHGRASFTIKDGKYSVVRDVAQSVPVQSISPRNSWGYGGSKVFTEIPHAIRVRFPNEEKQYADDEVVVYRPGYNEDGTGGKLAASTFDTLDMPGCSRASQAWREGMYHYAVLLLRPETHVVTMDIENLRCGLGDLVRFSHDAIKIGLAFGRVKSVVTSGGNVTHLTFDGPVEMSNTKTYGVRCRKGDFASVVMPLAAFNGETDTVQLVTPLPIANAPSAGDLYQFGESGLEAAPMMVKRIVPGRDLTATVTLVDAQPGVWTADTGVIPPFNTYITSPVPIDRLQPAAPVFRLTSDSNTARYIGDGTVIERISVGFDALPSSEVPIDHIELHYRDTLSPDFSPLYRDLPADTSGVFIEPVTAGDTYEVRARCVSAEGTPSQWAYRSILAAGKTIPPGRPKGLTASAGVGAQSGKITLSVQLADDADLWATEIWGSPTNNRASATLVASLSDPALTFDHALAGTVNRYYWARSLDLSGNYSTANTDPANQWFPSSATAGVLGQTRAIAVADVDAGFADKINQIAIDAARIDDLFDVYGDTVAAEASAAAAAASAAAAELSRSASAAAAANSAAANALAESARNDAQAARTAAISARDTAVAKALEASGSAGTASGHATTATNAASAASGSASAAAGSAVVAQSAAANAAYLDAYAAYTFANTTDGWSVTGGTLTPAANYVTFASTSADPILQRAVSFPGSRFTRIMVDLERTAGAAWDGNAYYTTAGHGYSGSYRKILTGSPAVGVRQTVVFDMANLSAGETDWVDNTITAIRLDLGNTASDVFKIYGIRIVGANTAAPAIAAAASAASAQAASTSATNAGTSASASDTARIAAQTARGAAETARDASAASAQTADGHRASAQTSASNAAGSASAAGGSASAASGSASSASTSASNAANSAAAALSSSISATATVVQALPGTFEAGGAYFTFEGNIFNNPPSLGVNTPTDGFASGTERGTVLYSNGVYIELSPKGRIDLKPGRSHRVSMNGVVHANGTNPHTWVVGFLVFGPSGADLGRIWTQFIPAAAGDGWVNCGGNVSVTTETIIAQHPGAAIIRPLALLGWSPGGIARSYSSFHVDSLLYSDVTESASAAGSATAAVSAASTAAAKATEAGTYANAADSSRVAAETARGQAQTSASNAATSESNAAGSASSASSAAGVSASARDAATAARDAALGYRDTAGGYASAAAGSASTAAARATDAGTYASAAQTDRLAAQTANTNAGLARDAAVAAQSGAAGSQAAAAQSATLAARVGIGGGVYANNAPSFALGLGAPDGSGHTIPLGWEDWTYGWDKTQVAGQVSDKAIRFVVPAGRPTGLYAASNGTPNYKGAVGPGWWVMEYTVTLESGSLDGAGGYLATTGNNFPLGEDQILPFVTNPDSSGVTPGNGSPGKTYSFARLFKLNNPATDRFVLYVMANWDAAAASSTAAKTIVYHFAGVRRATAAEIETGIARAGYASVAARISAEESVRASETAALATRVTATEARASVQANLIPNSNAAQGARGWTVYGPGGINAQAVTGEGSLFYRPSSGFVASDGLYTSPRFAVYGGNTYSFQAEMRQIGMTSGSVRAYITWFNAGGAVTGYTVTQIYASDPQTFIKKRLEGIPAPEGSTGAQVAIDVENGQFNPGGQAAWKHLKLELGTTCTGWTDDATDVQVSARTSIVESSVADAQSKLAVARLVLLAEATGGRPARMGLYSDNYGGSSIALDAAKIYFGDNTVFDDASDTLQTVTGSIRRVIAWGSTFGPDGLFEWVGDNSVALSAMTRANAQFYMASSSPYIGGNAITPAVETGFVIGGSASPVRTAVGATSIGVSAAVTGATGNVYYKWSQVSGDPCTISNVNIANPTITVPNNVGYVVGLQCTINDELKLRQKFVTVIFRSNV